MRILVTGSRGQLGNDCVIESINRGYDVIGSGNDDTGVEYQYKSRFRQL